MVYPVPWYLSFLISFPQTIIILLLGFTLFNLNIPLIKLMLIAALFSIFSYFIRHCPITLTMNSLIGLTVIILLSIVILNYRIQYVIPPVMCGFIIYACIETFEAFLVFNYTKFDLKSIIENPWIDFWSFFPALILAIAGYFLIKHYRLVIFDLSKKVLINY